MSMIALDPFDRQRRIPGWRQEQLQQARVGVLGRDWLGALVVWALRSLGIGETTWIGRPRPETEELAWFLMRMPGSGSGGTILDEPFDVEYGPELAWALGGIAPDILVCTTEDRDELRLALDWADRKQVPALAGRTSGGGWFGTDPPPVVGNPSQDPVIALVVAAMLVDAVRERLCPLSGRLIPRQGGLSLRGCSQSSHCKNILLVGVGGVGVWAAAALAAEYGDQLHLRLWDFDRVALENLNRQALFTEEDALAQAPKADAALRSLARIFPRVRLASEVSRLGLEDAARLEALVPRPTAILSAVDNAATRLVLQQLGRELGLPVIQGGTAIFAADCFTQTVGGPLLDDQMYGALSTASARESQESRESGGCAAAPSYIVPGMMAGAFMAYRLGQLGQEASLAPIRWRMGDHPLESRNTPHVIDLGSFFGRVDQDAEGAARRQRAVVAMALAGRRP
jgi:molybdopterin/thiamine biosynthesis adenylyltransferase